MINGFVFRGVYHHMKLKSLSVLLACSACAAGPGHSWEAAYVRPIESGLTREQQIEHALNRLAYGPRPGDVERVKRIGLEQWIGLQLTPERLTDAAADSAMASYRTLAVPTRDLAETFREVRMAERDSTRSADMRDSRRLLQLSMAEVAAAFRQRRLACSDTPECQKRRIFLSSFPSLSIQSSLCG